MEAFLLMLFCICSIVSTIALFVEVNRRIKLEEQIKELKEKENDNRN